MLEIRLVTPWLVIIPTDYFVNETFMAPLRTVSYKFNF
jgi:hypothetical protein